MNLFKQVRNLKVINLALFVLFLGAYAGAIIAFALQVILARVLSVEEYGIFSSVYTFLMIISPLVGFGVGTLLLKVFAKEEKEGIRWLFPVLKYSLITMFIVSLIVVLRLVFGEEDSKTNNLMIILSVIVISQGVLEFVAVLFQLDERFKFLSFWHVAPHFLRFLLVILLYFIITDFDVYSVAIAYLIVSFITIFWGVSFVVRFIIRRQYQLSSPGSSVAIGHASPSLKRVFVEASPYGLSTFFYLVYFQIGIVIAQIMVSNQAAAQYSVAIVFLSGIYLFPGVVCQKYFLPKVHVWFVRDKAVLARFYSKARKQMFIVSLLVVVGLNVFGLEVITKIFGQNYEYASYLLALLSISIPFRFLSSVSSMIITLDKYIHYKNVSMFFAVMVSVLVSVYSSSEYGIYAIVCASVVSEILIFTLYSIVARKVIRHG